MRLFGRASGRQFRLRPIGRAASGTGAFPACLTAGSNSRPDLTAPGAGSKASSASADEINAAPGAGPHCLGRASKVNPVKFAPVAQLDRALPSEGKGRTFESCRARQKSMAYDNASTAPSSTEASRKQGAEERTTGSGACIDSLSKSRIAILQPLQPLLASEAMFAPQSEILAGLSLTSCALRGWLAASVVETSALSATFLHFTRSLEQIRINSARIQRRRRSWRTPRGRTP